MYLAGGSARTCIGKQMHGSNIANTSTYTNTHTRTHTHTHTNTHTYTHTHTHTHLLLQLLLRVERVRHIEHQLVHPLARAHSLVSDGCEIPGWGATRANAVSRAPLFVLHQGWGTCSSITPTHSPTLASHTHTFHSLHLLIRVYTHNQHVTQRPRLAERIGVSEVKQVKASINPHADLLARLMFPQHIGHEKVDDIAAFSGPAAVRVRDLSADAVVEVHNQPLPRHLVQVPHARVLGAVLHHHRQPSLPRTSRAHTNTHHFPHVVAPAA